MSYTEEELEHLVESGELTEEQALRLLDAPPRSRSPKASRGIHDINLAHEQYTNGLLDEDAFYKSLARFIEALVKRRAFDQFSYTNTEDAITTSLVESWQHMDRFDPTKGAFRSFVSLIVLRNIKDAYKKYRAERDHTPLDDAVPCVARGLDAEKRLLFKEWLRGLSPMGRTVAQMTMDGLTLREIAMALNMSHEGVRRHLNKLKLTKAPWQSN